MQDTLHRVLLKTKEQILHITSVLYLLLGSPNVLSLADVLPKQLISFPDILRQTFQSLVPQFLRHPVKASAMPPVMQARVSLSPPRETALRSASLYIKFRL